MRRAVFLDRDGTLMHSMQYRPANNPTEVRLMDGVPEGLSLLKKAGLLLVVVTNQGGIEKGVLKLEMLHKINRELDDQIVAAGGPSLDAFYWCPHMPVRGKNQRQCYCRKPSPGMLLDAAKMLKIDLGASYIIGDDPRDTEAGALADLAGLFLIDPKIEGHPYSASMDGGATVHVRETFLHAATNVADLARITPWEVK